MATYLLTGGTGFLGGYILRELVQAGHQVVVLCRKPIELSEASQVRIVTGDILNQSDVQRAAEGCDGLFHCAGMVSRDPDDARAMMEINVEGTKRALDGAKAAGVSRVVYMSTSGTIAIREDFDEAEDDFPHEEAPTPYGLIGRWPYYRSKLFAEGEALKRNAKDFEVICLNPSLLLGPGDVRGGATKDVVWFLKGKVPVTPSGGLSFVDVRDVAKTALVAMKRGIPGERYLLGACNLSFADFLGRLSRLSDVEAPLLVAPKHKTLSAIGNALFTRLQDSFGSSDGPDEASLDMARYFWYLDESKARIELQFQPRDPQDTLRDTVEDLQQWDEFTAPHRGNQTLQMRYHLLEGLAILESQAAPVLKRATQAIKGTLQSKHDV